MIKNYESRLADETLYNLTRAQNSAPQEPNPMEMTDTQPVQVASRAGGVRATIREMVQGVRRMGQTKTDDILDNVRNKRNVMSPEAMADIEATLTNQTESAQELAGDLPIAASASDNTEQVTPFFEHKPLASEDIVGSMANETPTAKRTPQRSYNIERHHQGARQAINATFEQMQSADDFAKVLDYIANETRTGGSRSFTEIKNSVNTPEDIFKELKPVFKGEQKGLLTDKQNYAARVLAASIFTDVQQIAKAISGGDDSAETLLALSMKTEQLNFIAQYVMHNATETARALSSHRLIAQALEGGSLEDISRLMDQVGGIQDVKHQAKLINTLVEQQENGMPNAASRYLGWLFKGYRKGVTAAAEYWRAQILTGVKTHIVNLSGTALQNAWDIGVIRPTAMMLGETRRAVGKVTGKEVSDYVSYQESFAQVASSFTTLNDSIRMMARAFKENEGRFSATTKGAEENVGAFEDVAKFFFGDRIGGTINDVGTGAYRVLGAEDELGKAIAYRQELSALSVRQAIREGLTGETMWNRANELQNSPSEEMNAAAMAFARRATFQDEITGPVLSKVVGATKQIIHYTPELQFIIPFVDTPTNLARRVFELSPYAPLTKGIQEQWKRGGAERDIAAAKVAWAWGMFAALWYAYDAGVITGPGPEKWDVKGPLEKAGWQPNAIKLGDGYYSVDRLAPFGQAFALVGGYRDKAKYAGNEAEFMEAVGTGVLIIADNLTDLPFLQGINVIMEAANGEYFNARKIPAGIISGGVPFSAMLKDVENLTDPMTRTVSQDNKAQSGVMDLAKQTTLTRLPGASFTMRPSRYWDGTPKMPDAGRVAFTLSPLKIGHTKKEVENKEINNELIKQGFGPAEPSPLVAWGGVEFSLVELDGGAGAIYDAYVKRVGAARVEVYGEIISSFDYQALEENGPESKKYSLILGGESDARLKGLAQFIEGDLQDLLEKSDSLSPIGMELKQSGALDSWVEEILNTYGERRDKNKDFEKSVRLRGSARDLAPKDIKLNPLN